MIHRSLLSIPALSLLLCASACSGAGADDTFEVSGDSTVFHTTGSRAALSAAELATYKADLAYVHHLVPDGVPVTLNHADERQHRFVLARLKLAGKTPENSPELFRGLEAERARQIAAGLAGKHAVAEVRVAPRDNAGGIQDLHMMDGLSLVNGGTQLQVISLASIHTALTHGLVDAAAEVPDGEGGTELIGDVAEIQVFGPMPFASPVALGDLAETDSDTLIGDSMLIETPVAGVQQTSFVAVTRTRGDIFNTPVVTGPTDVTGDGCVNVCINRGNADCDYTLTSTVTRNFLLPFQGSVSINTPSYAAGFRIDEARVAQLAAGTATGADGSPITGGDITVILTNSGGGCPLNGPTQINIPERQFWQTVTVNNNDQTLTWNMDGAALANFGVACSIATDKVEFKAEIDVPWVDAAGHHGTTSEFISNNANANPKLVNSCFHVIDSCLAAGTMIEMADGRSAPIESIHAGAQVFSPYDHADSALAVMDVTKGTEPIPMVRIEDEHGRSLLLTETHPVQLPGRGMVAGKYLKEGDVVMTKSGPSRLVHVRRERFTGTVHNLKIGNKAELAKLGNDETAMYANGFLVGDTQIQKTHDLAELSKVGQPAPVTRLATRWRADYEHMKSSQP